MDKRYVLQGTKVNKGYLIEVEWLGFKIFNYCKASHNQLLPIINYTLLLVCTKYTSDIISRYHIYLSIPLDLIDI